MRLEGGGVRRDGGVDGNEIAFPGNSKLDTPSFLGPRWLGRSTEGGID